MLKSTSVFLRSLGLTRPTVVIDESRARANLARMAAKARASGVFFRPHFKTHQSVEIGRWFADEGVTRITVSSLVMAERFAAAGWNDITLAFLLNPLELPRLRELAGSLKDRGGSLGVTLDSLAAARLLAGSRDLPCRVWIKVDTGYGRTGVPWDRTDRLTDIIRELGPEHAPTGLLTHAGNTYGARGSEQVSALGRESVRRMNAARAALGSAGGPGDLLLSIGDTPFCSIADRFEGVDEIRPGNFVFNDLMQLNIGSCGPGGLAVAVACPVVGIYPERGRIVIHGGAVHLSKEILDSPGGRPLYGLLGDVAIGGEPGLGRVLDQAPVVSLSQEHGVIEVASGEFSAVAVDLEIGDLVLIWPVHSCLTCNLHPEGTTRIFKY